MSEFSGTSDGGLANQQALNKMSEKLGGRTPGNYF